MSFPLRSDRNVLLSTARNYAFEEYCVALFSPRDVVDSLLVVAAYTGDLNRISLQVRDPILAEIRFQWWREALERGHPTGHPVADALLELREKKQLPVDLLLSHLESRFQELDPRVLTCDTSREAYWRVREHPYLDLHAFLYGYANSGDGDGPVESLLSESAEILGILRYCRRLPLLWARLRSRDAGHLGQKFSEPQDLIFWNEETFHRTLEQSVGSLDTTYSRLKGKLRALEGGTHVLFLPLALVQPHLNVLRKQISSNSYSGLSLKDPLPLSFFLSFFLFKKFQIF